MSILSLHSHVAGPSNRHNTPIGRAINYASNSLNQYTSVGGTGYSYDNSDNLTNTNNGVYEYVYDCENRLIEAKENSQTIDTYTYDYLGRRVSKTQYAIPDTQYYVYDGGQVIAEYEGDTLVRKFIYGPGIDEPICIIDAADNNAVYYYHFEV